MRNEFIGNTLQILISIIIVCNGLISSATTAAINPIRRVLPPSTLNSPISKFRHYLCAKKIAVALVIVSQDCHRHRHSKVPPLATKRAAVLAPMRGLIVRVHIMLINTRKIGRIDSRRWLLLF